MRSIGPPQNRRIYFERFSAFFFSLRNWSNGPDPCSYRHEPPSVAKVGRLLALHASIPSGSCAHRLPNYLIGDGEGDGDGEYPFPDVQSYVIYGCFTLLFFFGYDSGVVAMLVLTELACEIHAHLWMSNESCLKCDQVGRLGPPCL